MKPSRLAHGIALLWIALAIGGCASQPRMDSTRPPIGASVASIAMTVSDMDRVLPFYTDVLTFTVKSDRTIEDPSLARLLGVEGAKVRIVSLSLGSEMIELIDYLTPEGRAFPADSRSNDLWFEHIAIIVSDMDKAHRRLVEHGVRPASRDGPQRLPEWNPNAAGIEAFYFRDPDGRFLEILAFPPGKGQERWQADDRLFLGIDHTAIVVSDTDQSLKLYRDGLGMKQIGASENYGPEQERLNNVFGARLRITALKGPGGPAIELLEYLSPSTGRPAPVDALSNDLSHWHIVVDVSWVESMERTGRSPLLRWVSPGVVRVPSELIGSDQALMARDPDGHAIVLRLRN